MSKKCLKSGWLLEFKQDFSKRWNINIIDERQDMVYIRCIELCSKMIKESNINNISQQVFIAIGKEYIKENNNENPFIKIDFSFKGTKLYNLLSYSNVKHGNKSIETPAFVEFLEMIEVIINCCYSEKDEKLLSDFNDILMLSNRGAMLVYDTKYRFYPSGIPILDKRVINDVLNFLEKYPKAHKEFSEALEYFIKNNNYRDCVDKTRLGLEIFLKELLNNDKSLENQLECIGNFLKNHNIHKEICNLFKNLLDTYKCLQNDNAKHDSGDFQKEEVEFLFYLCGSFIRLFMQISHE